jgi:hypothetical protein
LGTVGLTRPPRVIIEGIIICLAECSPIVIEMLDDDYNPDKSVVSAFTEHSNRDRFKVVLGEQLQINEKLEIENERNKIQLRKLTNLLKSSLVSTSQGQDHLTA